jgi:hypothetical protein
MVTKQHRIPPLVEVFWWDHYSIGDNWYDKHDTHEPCILSAVGYVVAENNHYYWIASTYEIATGSYSSGTAVLKNCVTHTNILAEARDIEWNGKPIPEPSAPTKRKRKP